VPIVERTLDGCAAAIKSVPGAADLIEIRLDYLDDLTSENSAAQIEALLKARDTFYVLTFRPQEQGGVRQLSKNDRLNFWGQLRPLILRKRKILCDIEWDIASETTLDWLKPELRIVSYHNLNDSPETENQIFKSLLDRPARLIKLAVKGNSISDNVRIKDNLELARQKNREMIGIVMDEPGLVSRVLGPDWGSYLTFASASKDKGSAPGQITIDELINRYRIRNITDDTLFTGLIGNPVSHSVSPAMHNAAFIATRMDGVYLPMPVNDLSEFLKRIVRPSTQELDWNLRGFSVTIPHKVAIIPLLDKLTDTAKAVGAVNTVTVEGDKLIGDNTDVQGALVPLGRQFHWSALRIAILGTGGAARAVTYGLKKALCDVTIFGKRANAATDLAKEFNAKSVNWNRLGEDHFDIVINATPIGMAGYESENTIPDEAITNCDFYYDLVYNPLETDLMRTAASAGVEVIGGLEMLVAQGAEQFKLWTLKDAPYEVMMEAALKELTVERKAS